MGLSVPAGSPISARLRAAGVPVTTVRYDGITHDFIMGFMSWFRRQGESSDDRASGLGVASDLAEFLVQSTEGKALIRAIGDANSHPEEPTVTPTPGDVPPSGAGDEW